VVVVRKTRPLPNTWNSYKMNSYRRQIFLTFSVCFHLFSCVVSVPCNKATFKLCLISFPDSTIQNIVLKRYKPRTDFKHLLDSSRVNDSLIQKHSDSLEFNIETEYDYEVYIPNLSRLYKISAINETNGFWKAGLVTRSSGCIDTVKSYKLNDKLISGNSNYERICIQN
jgi:hypothetical protein